MFEAGGVSEPLLEDGGVEEGVGFVGISGESGSEELVEAVTDGTASLLSCIFVSEGGAIGKTGVDVDGPDFPGRGGRGGKADDAEDIGIGEMGALSDVTGGFGGVIGGGDEGVGGIGIGGGGVTIDWGVGLPPGVDDTGEAIGGVSALNGDLLTDGRAVLGLGDGEIAPGLSPEVVGEVGLDGNGGTEVSRLEFEEGVGLIVVESGGIEACELTGASRLAAIGRGGVKGDTPGVGVGSETVGLSMVSELPIGVPFSKVNAEVSVTFFDFS